ncbi:MAG: hypothetical protein AAGE52_05465 [Myxococcota bacterium]
MTLPRSESVDLDATPFYHCISRCVRRAYLCGRDPRTGEDFEHRKEWVEQRIAALSAIFAIDIYAYAVMSNHLHVVLRVDRERAEGWSDDEIVRRHNRLFRFSKATLKSLPPEQQAIKIANWRERLSSLSWFMRLLNESIARRANREDGCTGRFWEGRFKSQALLDERALLACMAYVDLNPIRAGISDDLRERFTSIGARLRTRGVPAGLVPFQDQVPAGSRRRKIDIGFREYTQLLRWTCRAMTGAKGRRPRALSANEDEWVATMSEAGLGALGALGSVEAMESLAERRGREWVHGKRKAAELFD